MKKLFVNTESVATFATSFKLIGKRKPAKYIFAGIFYALTILIINITVATPVLSVNAPTAYEVKDNGKGQPFFLPKMPKISFKMAELVFQNSNGNDITTSLIVAQVFGKEHNKVVRDIENLSCSESFRSANFGVSFTIRDLPNGGHKQERYYEMTKDGFSFLVMGYTGAKAGEFKERFINEFNKREAMLKNDDYILMRSQQILQKRLEASEEKIKKLEVEKQALIEETKPAVVFTECVKNSPTNQILPKTFAVLKSICIFAMRHFYIHIWFGDFLCPIVSNCIKYKQRFLRTYSPQSQYGSVATWRDSLLSLFINF